MDRVERPYRRLRRAGPHRLAGVTVLYLAMAMGLRAVFGALYYLVFERGRVWP